MATSNFDELLARMPAIAEAVNSFGSEQVQQLAFQALVRSFQGDAAEPEPEEQQAPRSSPGSAEARPKAGSSRKRSSKKLPKSTAEKATSRRSRKGPAIVRDLNLRPKGKLAFRDFAKQKAPGSIDEKNVVSVYYLKHQLGIDKVSVDHIFSCYREAEGWRLPANLANRLSVTASTKGWLDTSDKEDIQVTAPGTNLIEHDLPRNPAS